MVQWQELPGDWTSVLTSLSVPTVNNHESLRSASLGQLSGNLRALLYLSFRLNGLESTNLKIRIDGTWLPERPDRLPPCWVVTGNLTIHPKGEFGGGQSQQAAGWMHPLLYCLLQFLLNYLLCRGCMHPFAELRQLFLAVGWYLVTGSPDQGLVNPD